MCCLIQFCNNMKGNVLLFDPKQTDKTLFYTYISLSENKTANLREKEKTESQRVNFNYCDVFSQNESQPF